jgi:hypothetical protein
MILDVVLSKVAAVQSDQAAADTDSRDNFV